MLIPLDYRIYSGALARFFDIEALPRETLAMDGKQLRGSYQLEFNNPDSPAASSYHAGERLPGRTRSNSRTVSSRQQN
ncbi:MAG: hypothetical protein AAFV85_26840 [Cyanobacteria bacterium J06634_6]